MAEQRYQAVLAVISDGLSISQVAGKVGVSRQMLELQRSRPYWGPRRLVFELAKRKVVPVPSELAVYRALLRAGLDRSEPAGSALAYVETLGTRCADGVVADGCGRRVPVGRWHQR